MALEMNMPELVRTSLSLLFPESLSATADLLSSDLACSHTQIHNRTSQTQTQNTIEDRDQTPMESLGEAKLSPERSNGRTRAPSEILRTRKLCTKPPIVPIHFATKTTTTERQTEREKETLDSMKSA